MRASLKQTGDMNMELQNRTFPFCFTKDFSNIDKIPAVVVRQTSRAIPPMYIAFITLDI